MALILSIETSTPTCSVALHEKGQTLTVQHLFVQQSHSVKLTSLIQQVLSNCDRSIQELDALAVAKGPGSYTGLRIGTATAKGLCYSLSKPLIAVNSLKAMAKAVTKYLPREILLCPMIDARRMEVYCAVFDREMNSLEETNAKIIDEHSFEAFFEQDKEIVFFGDGAQKCQAVLGHQKKANFIPNIHPSAETVGEIATAYFELNTFEDIAYFEPFYLKEFVTKAKD